MLPTSFHFFFVLGGGREREREKRERERDMHASGMRGSVSGAYFLVFCRGEQRAADDEK